jgi:hypothetical protein
VKPRRSTCTASALALLALIIAACGEDGKGVGPVPAFGSVDLSPEPTVELPDVAFEDVTEEAGIRFRHATGAFGKKYLPETMGSGVVFLDYDGDHWPDLLFVNSDRWPERGEDPRAKSALYRNLGNGKFRDVTEEAGCSLSLYGMGAAAADIDGDGDVDVYVTAMGDNVLLVNEGGRFVDRTAAAGVVGGQWKDEQGREHPEWSSGAAFLDYDRDGDLDLFVANYVKWSEETDLFTTMDGKTKAYTTPRRYPGLFPRLYRNRGDGTFEDSSGSLRFDEHAEPKALGVLVTDFDRDGWPDLFVTNDTQPNNLLRNEGDGTFRDVALKAGVAFDENGAVRAGMGAAETVLPDGRLVLTVGNFSREAIAFYRRHPSGLFVDSAPAVGLGSPTQAPLTFGMVFFDYDLDGLEDLVIANGHIEPTIHEVQAEVTYAQPPMLFKNRDGRRYADASAGLGGDFAKPMVARGLAVADYDRDGDLDLVFSTNGGPARLLRNRNGTGRSWLRVRLRMPGGNPDAVGARVIVSGGGLERSSTVRAGGSYLSQDEYARTFGLGDLDAAERLTVIWPDGIEETHEGVPANREYLVERGKPPTELPRK